MPVLLVILLSISVVNDCHSVDQLDEPQGPDLMTFGGKVVSIDLSRSTIVVNFVNELTFSVPTNTPVKNDIYDIRFSDIRLGDNVTIEYYKDSSDKLITTKITVNTD